MLNSLRSAAQSWIAKILLLLLVVSFGVWGVSSSMLTGPASNSVMEAGNSKVSINEYRLAYDRQLRVLSQQFGQRLTADQARALGVDRQVASQLASGLVLDELANALNLGLSEKKLAALTAEDPAFHNSTGQFDRFQFDSVLRNAGMRPEDYLDSRQKLAKRQQIVEAAVDGITVPKAYLDALSIYDAETRDVSYFVLGEGLIEPKPVPDEAALAAYFEANKNRYRKPEYRSFKYVRLTPEDIADQVPVSDEDIQADYERNIARFTEAEKRVVQQIVFPDRASADAARASIDAGSTFDDVLAGRNVSASDATLGTLAKTDIADATIAEAAFGLAEGGVSPVVDGAFGPVLVRVTEIRPESKKTLDEVRDEIRNELAINQAADTVLNLHDSYEDARGGGASLEEAASQINIPVTVVDQVDEGGLSQAGARADLPEATQLLNGVFQSEIGDDVPPISIGATGFVWYEVTDIVASRDATLDEVRDLVAADWTAEETTKLLSAKADAALSALKDGKALADIASENGLEVQTAFRISRNSPDATLGQAGTAAAFGGPDGHSAVSVAADGSSRVLLQVTNVNRPTADPDRLAAAIRDNASRALADDVFNQLVLRLQTDIPVQVNQTAINQALN